MSAQEEFLTIDGSQGEGGGQNLRTCLALSLCLGRPFSIHDIRRHRPRPGLLPQHLMAVKAAASISGARVEGADPGSLTLRFEPGPAMPGEYHFSIGTAGSTTLVLQTLLPALLAASAPTRLVLDGGTHNPLAPSFHFLSGAFVPLLRRMGAHATLRLARPGFYPAGGGRLEADIEPCKRLAPLHLEERGPVQAIYVLALLSRLPRHIGERELRVIGEAFRVPKENRHIEEVAEPRGPGNALVITVASENVTEVFTGFGQRRLPAEQVAGQAAAAVRRYLDAGVPVGEHLADQLLLPFALAGGGSMRTLRPSGHTTTSMAVIGQFLPLTFKSEQEGEDDWRITVTSSASRTRAPQFADP